VKALLHHGADVNALPSPVPGSTALGLAMAPFTDHDYDLTVILLDAGADVLADCNCYGETALDEAARIRDRTMLELLVNHSVQFSENEKTLLLNAIAYHCHELTPGWWKEIVQKRST
jgi:ankyrin repeat protein